MSEMNQCLRVLAILADADHQAFLASARARLVMRAPDPLYGHTCCSRGAHTVSKLYYSAGVGPIATRIEADTYYRAFSTVKGGPSTETDLLDGLRRSTTLLAMAA